MSWQAHGVSLGLAGTVVVAFTATLAAVGAAAIPSAGLVTMLMVLQVSPSLILHRKTLLLARTWPPRPLDRGDLHSPSLLWHQRMWLGLVLSDCACLASANAELKFNWTSYLFVCAVYHRH